jgi:hypothetical protein
MTILIEFLFKQAQNRHCHLIENFMHDGDCNSRANGWNETITEINKNYICQKISLK